MASGWNSGTDREAMLRRVAIVLSSLPAPVASKLLGTIDEEKRQAVRRTMSSLTEVDPLERQRAIKAFKVMVERQPPDFSAATYESRDSRYRAGDHTATDSSSSARRMTKPDSGTPSGKPAKPSPLSFLDEVDDQTLAMLLKGEHPQTSALVLASISPEQAARVLPRLGPKLQQDTMSRIGRLGEIPDTAIVEVAEHFRSRLQEQTTSEHHRLGKKALDAILAAMPAQASRHASSDREPAGPFPGGMDHIALGRQVPHGFRGETTEQQSSESTENGFPIQARSSDSPAVDLAHRLRVFQESSPPGAGANDLAGDVGVMENKASAAVRRRERERSGVDDSFSDDASVIEGDRSPRHHVLESTDAIHQHLVGLQPTELCRALARVDTRDAMLALCGLPVQVTNAALAVLPRGQAKAVRIKMNSLGSLHLREIDLAKEKVAKASLGELPSPSLRSPLAA